MTDFADPLGVIRERLVAELEWLTRTSALDGSDADPMDMQGMGLDARAYMQLTGSALNLSRAIAVLPQPAAPVAGPTWTEQDRIVLLTRMWNAVSEAGGHTGIADAAS